MHVAPVAHCGYFVPLTKLGDFLKAGVRVKVLLAGERASRQNVWQREWLE